ncbi:MAG: translation elongation factor Tu, partial [Alectoria fallacina]
PTVLIDCPGHTNYIENTIIGAANMDGAVILVGIQKIIVFVNYVEVVQDKERLEIVEIEMRELLTQYGFEGEEILIIFSSALWAIEGKNSDVGVEKIDEFLHTVDI